MGESPPPTIVPVAVEWLLLLFKDVVSRYDTRNLKLFFLQRWEEFFEGITIFVTRAGRRLPNVSIANALVLSTITLGKRLQVQLVYRNC